MEQDNETQMQVVLHEVPKCITVEKNLIVTTSLSTKRENFVHIVVIF